MSERGKRVFRFLLDPERDTDVIGRIEAQPSMTGYVRELVRRDIHEREMHDERLDFAALKASELQAENAKLRELVADMWNEGMCECGSRGKCAKTDYSGEYMDYFAERLEAARRDETCHDTGVDRFECSGCGCTLDLEDAASCEPTMWVDGEAAVPRFCPNCGRRVEQ